MIIMWMRIASDVTHET